MHYFIPGIGIYNLDIEKAEPVKILYDFLDEVGEIDRLKNLDHLGIVREVIDGARHSRFDYIALIFALIDNWAQKVEEIHARSRVRVKLKVGKEEKVRGRDLIKCWALLFNIGHLDWTFFTERILLEVLSEEKLHTKLIESIEDRKIRKKAEEIFKFRDYNHFYQILAYLRFECLRKNRKDKINEENKSWFEVYKEMFGKYIVDDFSDKVKESNLPYLKSLYRTVRNIAFLLLDSFYTPSGLNLSPILLFDSPELIRSIVFGETEISNILKFLNRQLYKSVYLSEKVLVIQSLHYEPLKGELTRKAKTLKNGKDICDFIEEIYGKLDIQEIRKNNREKKSEYVPIIRFEFESDDLDEKLKEKLDESLVETSSNLNRYKVVWKTPSNFYVIQYNSKVDKQSAVATFKESFDMVRKFLMGIKDKDNWVGYIEHKRDVIERIGKRYIEQTLKIFFNNEGIRWEWKHTSFLRNYFNFPDAVIGFTDGVNEFYEKNIILKFDKKYYEKSEISELYKKKMTSIRKELYAKLKVIKILKDGEASIEGKPDILCITISNLIAYFKRSGKPCMEIDGLILGLTTGKQLFICLIEAKSGKRNNAVRNLKSRITNRGNDIFKGYDISNLISSVKGLDDNSIAYLIITDEKIPISSNP